MKLTAYELERLALGGYQYDDLCGGNCQLSLWSLQFTLRLFELYRLSRPVTRSFESRREAIMSSFTRHQ